MKKHILNSAFALSLAFLLSACEKTLPYDNDEQGGGITLNAFAVSDTAFVATVSKTYSLSESYNEWAINLMESALSDSEVRRGYQSIIIPDAEAKLTVNGQQEYILQYDSTFMNYRTFYVPKPGDELSVEIMPTSGLSGGNGTIRASTCIPDTPSFEVIGIEAYTQTPTDPWSDFITDSKSGQIYPIEDTGEYMSVTIRIDDPTGNNYYRLLVRSVSESTDILSHEHQTYYVNDTFDSDDPVFYDQTLSKQYGGWPEYFSNVFDDHLFDGTSYTLTINDIRRMAGNNSRVDIILQSLSRDTYLYLKSMQRYRIKDTSEYGESLYIHSNVVNGTGIFGSLSESRISMPFPEIASDTD